MEEEKAAALYEELTRKGGGAARFKQGLGFSSATTTSNDPPSRGSALPSSSSSFMSNFVRASSQTKEIEVDKKTQIENIQNKLKKKEPISSTDKIRVRDKDRRRSSSREKNLRSRSRSRSRSRERRRRSRSRSRSRERRKRSTSRDREKDLRSRRRNGGFDEDRDGSRRRYRSSSRERRRKRSRGRRSRSRSRSFSPTDRRRSERRRNGGGRDTKMVKESGNGTVDYAKSIDGYDNMTPAERVKAKIKLQLSQTAQKDTNLGSGSQWERFDFNKDAPVDDKEIEAADDDASLVKHIGRSFRFTSLEAKREDEIENAHDQAIFGIPAPIPSYTSETEERGGENKNMNENKGSTNDDDPASSLISEKVLSKQQGSWRDRARKNTG